MISCLFSKTFLFVDWVFQSFEVICVWQISITSSHKLVADAMRNARLTSCSKLYAYHVSLDPIFRINTNPMLSWSNNSAFSRKNTETMRWKVQFFLPWSQLLLRMTMQNSKPSASFHNTLYPAPPPAPNRDFWLTLYTPAYSDVIIHKLPLGIFLFYVILTIYYLRAQTIETSSLPNDPMRPILKQMTYCIFQL